MIDRFGGRATRKLEMASATHFVTTRVYRQRIELVHEADRKRARNRWVTRSVYNPVRTGVKSKTWGGTEMEQWAADIWLHGNLVRVYAWAEDGESEPWLTEFWNLNRDFTWSQDRG